MGGLANLRQKIEDTEGTLERSFQNDQQHAAGEIRKEHQKLVNSLKEETRLRSLSLQEICKKVENDISALSEKCDTLKLDVSKEYKNRHSQLERIVSEQQVSNLTSSVYASHERMQ